MKPINPLDLFSILPMKTVDLVTLREIYPEKVFRDENALLEIQIECLKDTVLLTKAEGKYLKDKYGEDYYQIYLRKLALGEPFEQLVKEMNEFENRNNSQPPQE